MLNAFRSAKGLSTACASLLPKNSKKFFIAHSLGNMLVCASRQFHGLEYEKYMMLNAAVPIEVVDCSENVLAISKKIMTPAIWREYPDKVKASHWYELFDNTDPRRMLTWKGLFRDVDNTVNFYSSRDEVVANGPGVDVPVFAREFAWYNQERNKGRPLVDLVPEAGWAFSDDYVVCEKDNCASNYKYRKFTAEEASKISEEKLIATPLFGSFTESGITGVNGGTYIKDKKNELFRFRVYSHGIPAESFAIGANAVAAWDNNDALSNELGANNFARNIDMAIQCNAVRDIVAKVNWTHSYFISRSLFDTYILFDKFVEQVK